MCPTLGILGQQLLSLASNRWFAYILQDNALRSHRLTLPTGRPGARIAQEQSVTVIRSALLTISLLLASAGDWFAFYPQAYQV